MTTPPVNYVTSGAWGSGVNRPLAAAEVDGNFWNHDQRITNVELLEPGVGIQSIVQTTPSQIAVTLTNGAVYYFTLPPLELTFRGEWAVNIFYAVNDVVTVTPMMAVYVVEVAHLSSSTGFNPGASDGAGNRLYGPFFTVPSNLPTGGTTGQVLAKVSGIDFNTAWQSSGVPRGGAAGLVLAKNSGTDFDTLWQALTFAMIAGSLAVAQLRFPVITALNDGGTGSVTLSPALGNLFTLAPANDVIITAGSAPADARVTLFVTAISVTSFNISFDATFVTTGTLAIGTTAGARFAISFVGDGTNLIEISRSGPM